MIIFFLLHLSEPISHEYLKAAYILKAAFLVLACVFGTLFSLNFNKRNINKKSWKDLNQ